MDGTLPSLECNDGAATRPGHRNSTAFSSRLLRERDDATPCESKPCLVWPRKRYKETEKENIYCERSHAQPETFCMTFESHARVAGYLQLTGTSDCFHHFSATEAGERDTEM